MRILAIDPGEKRIGIALSDPTGTIASPLIIIQHKSFDENILTIHQLINQYQVQRVVVGVALDPEGEETSSSRRARKLGEGLKNRFSLDVRYLDEYGTTNEAITSAFSAGKRRKDRREHLDSVAAAILLQRYIEMEMDNPTEHEP